MGLASIIRCDTAAALRALDGSKRFDGDLAHVSKINEVVSGNALATPASYRFVSGSTTPDNNQSQLAVVPTSGSGSGRWVRADLAFELILPITFATADANALATIPAELWLVPTYLGPWWEMITAWTGGAAPTIGLSYTNQATPVNVPGSLLGGAGGDGTFPVRSYYRGTAGSHFTGGLKRIVLNPGATINYDRVSTPDNFTAGTGNAHVPLIQTYAPIVPVNPS